jgi:hypothetical protein
MGRTDDATAGRAGQGAPGRFAGLLGRALPVVAMAAVLLHPTQVTVRQWADAAAATMGFGQGLAQRVPSAHFTVSDALFALAFLLWLVVRLWDRTFLTRIRAYPIGMVAVFVAGALSLIAALKYSPPWSEVTMEPSGGVKQLVQLFLFFVCAYVVLSDCLRDRAWRGRLVAAFLAAAAVAMLVGLTEYLRLRPPSPEAQRAGALISPMQVDATFGFQREAAGAHEKIGTASNRNVLGAWLTLVLPLLWAVFLWERRRAIRAVALVLSLLGGVLLLNGGLWAAALVAVLAVSFVRGRTAFIATAAGMLLFYALLFRSAPQEPGQVLLDSVMLQKQSDRFRTLSLYEVYEDLDKSGRGADLTQGRFAYPWQQKYVEWQPALLALAQNPLFGVGLGNYQKNVNRYYGDKNFNTYQVSKPPLNLMEKDANPFYAVWLAETGLVGLLAFVWLLAEGLGRGIAGFAALKKAGGDELMAGLTVGACAALGAAAAGCLFTDYWVRGVGIAFVFVLALASCADGEGE